MGDGSVEANDRDVVHVVSVVEHGSDPHLELVAAGLAVDHAIVRCPISLSGTVLRLSGEARRVHDLFQHTPQPLIDAWVLARAVAAGVPNGANVLVPDAHGVGGMLAIVEAARPHTVRRRVWSTAGAGVYLRTQWLLGTTEHLDPTATSEVDWELVGYRNAERVLATSEIAVELLAREGISAEMGAPSAGSTGTPAEGGHPSTHRAVRSVWAPGPVGRAGRSGDIMRAVLGVDPVRLVVSESDVADAIWNETTWDANRAVVQRLGSRIRRSAAAPDDADIVVIGDAFTVPGSSVARLRDRGLTIAAPTGSVTASMWPDVAEWDTSDDLAAILDRADGSTADPASPAEAGRPDRSDVATPLIAANGERARRISVGIPAFGEPDHLDGCLRSVLAQTEPVAEILVIDDGSRSPALARTLETWRTTDDRIRILTQPNRGVCVARNRMLESMTGDAFVLVDQDDVLAPEFVAATANALRSDASLTAVAVWTEFFGEYAAIEAKPPFDRRVAHRENPIVSTAALVDMSVVADGLRFEPDLAFLFCEDWNFWSQIVASGGRMGLVPAPLVRHRVHRASGGFQRTDLAHAIGKARAIAPFHRSSV